MNTEDIFIPLTSAENYGEDTLSQKIIWEGDLPEKGVLLLFLTPEDSTLEELPLYKERVEEICNQLAQLSEGTWEIPVHVAGILKNGRTTADTAYILREIVETCAQRNTLPLFFGGSPRHALLLAQAIQQYTETLHITYLTPAVQIEVEGAEITERNLLGKLLSDTEIRLRALHLVGIQNHLSHLSKNQLIREMDFEFMRLAEIAEDTSAVEPHLRQQDLFVVNCDAIESSVGKISRNAQVNGINRREICRVMQEAGLSSQLKAAHLFNFNGNTKHRLHFQLVAQMIWYFCNGYNTRLTHPTTANYEYYVITMDDVDYQFRHDLFSTHWDVRHPQTMQYHPCLRKDWELARTGQLSPRLLKLISE